MALNKKQILDVKDLPIEEVFISEWNDSVFVRGLNGRERDSFELSVIDQKSKNKVNLENIRAKLCALTICDENGELLFSENEVNEVAKKSGAALGKIFVVAQRLSGLSENDVKEMSENFLSDPKDVSTSNLL